jgi:hypothetical protein
MEIYLILVLYVTAFMAVEGADLVVTATQRRRQKASWRAALKSQGLTNITESKTLWDDRFASGRNGPFHVLMAAAAASPLWTQIEVDSPRRLLAPLRVWSRHPLDGEGTRTGDDAFDRAFCVTGSPADAHALLDAETRSVLTRLGARGRLEVTDGTVRLTVRDDLGESLRLLLSATRGLPTGLDLPQRLAENAGGTGSASTRAQSLLKLAQEFREHPLTRKTLEAACADPSPEVRLRAALELGEEHLDVMFAIAEDAAVDDTSAANAVYALGPRLVAERAMVILEAALRARRRGTAHACLERLRSVPDPAVNALITKVLAIERGELAVHAAQALADMPRPGVEETLVAALARDADVRQAAAEALGRCGSIAAVLPLKEAAERHAETDFQRAVRQAVAQIQERASGASPGQLSIASAEAGQVSLADAEAGRLSLPPQEGGEMSLADDEKPGCS